MDQTSGSHGMSGRQRGRQLSRYEGRGVPKMYQRLVAPDLLPTDVERVLYLDGDLLIRDQLDEIWETPLDGAIIAARARLRRSTRLFADGP